jgi:hypothetical protein
MSPRLYGEANRLAFIVFSIQYHAAPMDNEGTVGWTVLLGGISPAGDDSF